MFRNMFPTILGGTLRLGQPRDIVETIRADIYAYLCSTVPSCNHEKHSTYTLTITLIQLQFEIGRTLVGVIVQASKLHTSKVLIMGYN